MPWTVKRQPESFQAPRYSYRTLLACKIRLLDGTITTVRDASSEQFDAYLMDVLARVYPEPKIAGRRMYDLCNSVEDGTIDRSTWDTFSKFYVLNRIAGLTEVRESGVALFVEDV